MDSKGRVPYRERVVLVGPGCLRDGEQHAAHPDVMGLILVPKDPDATNTIELWLRASAEQCDAQGHTAFIPITAVEAPSQLHPAARAAVDWKRK